MNCEYISPAPHIKASRPDTPLYPVFLTWHFANLTCTRAAAIRLRAAIACLPLQLEHWPLPVWMTVLLVLESFGICLLSAGFDSEYFESALPSAGYPSEIGPAHQTLVCYQTGCFDLNHYCPSVVEYPVCSAAVADHFACFDRCFDAYSATYDDYFFNMVLSTR